MITLKSCSSEETRGLGKKLAESFVRRSTFAVRMRKRGFVVALDGDLGSGKTTFTQGFAQGLGIKKRATSPTFIIFRRFAIRHSPFAHIYHVDAYRIKHPSELDPLEFKKILSNPKNIVLIEWAENIQKILPKGALRVRFRHGAKENERVLTFAISGGTSAIAENFFRQKLRV